MRLSRLLLFAAILLPLPALADTYTYTYTGNDFRDIVSGYGSPYSTADLVSGSFTVPTPLINSTLQTVYPLVFSFTDGIQTLTNQTAAIDYKNFQLETGTTGAIVGWSITIAAPSPNNEIETAYFPGNPPNYNFDLGENGGNFSWSDPTAVFYASEGFNVDTPGTWFVTDNRSPTSAATPEPSSLVLFVTGLGSFALARRRTS